MKRLSALFALLLLLLLPASTAFAYNPLGNACGTSSNVNGGTVSSTACSTNGQDPITGSDGVLWKVTLVVATVGAITAIIIIMVAGLSMITSSGDTQRVAQARRSIIGALVGLVLIAIAESVVVFVVGRLP
jgi:hypothetical protein